MSLDTKNTLSRDKKCVRKSTVTKQDMRVPKRVTRQASTGNRKEIVFAVAESIRASTSTKMSTSAIAVNGAVKGSEQGRKAWSISPSQLGSSSEVNIAKPAAKGAKGKGNAATTTTTITPNNSLKKESKATKKVAVVLKNKSTSEFIPRPKKAIAKKVATTAETVAPKRPVPAQKKSAPPKNSAPADGKHARTQPPTVSHEKSSAKKKAAVKVTTSTKKTNKTTSMSANARGKKKEVRVVRAVHAAPSQSSRAAPGKERSTQPQSESRQSQVKVVKLTTVALKKHEMRNDDLVSIRPPNRGDSWDGNSEADGSVNSGILDENVCFACGEVTTEEEASEIVVCDECGGDYHFRCQGLQLLPRLAFKCRDCHREQDRAATRSFELHDALMFPPLRRRKGQKAEVCYSPSRPLDMAWRECEAKGFMLVKAVFSDDVIDKLTHGGVQQLTKYGRVAEDWTGAVNVLSKQINQTTHNVINRDGRFDIKIPNFVVRELRLEELLEPILTRLRSIMSPHRTPQLRTHNIILAPMGSDSQTWHFDDSRKKGKHHSYFTILIHLNSIDDLCGGTEIWSQSLKRGDLIRGRPGDAFVFNGSLLHRGQGNRGFSHRWFYYASFSCTQDANEVRL